MSTREDAAAEPTAATLDVPTRDETVRDEVAPFRDMTPEERLVWFVRLQRSMDAFVALRGADADARELADRGLGLHWRDPFHGRPR